MIMDPISQSQEDFIQVRFLFIASQTQFTFKLSTLLANCYGVLQRDASNTDIEAIKGRFLDDICSLSKVIDSNLDTINEKYGGIGSFQDIQSQVETLLSQHLNDAIENKRRELEAETVHLEHLCNSYASLVSEYLNLSLKSDHIAAVDC